MAWSQLLWFKHGPGVQMPTFEVEGDLADSWTQPDDTTFVFKLRPGVKFHNIAPVNGRVVDAEDVIKSFQRQIDFRVNGSYLAGVTKLEAPDSQTVRITIDQPNADFLWSIANPFVKVLPKELLDRDLKEGPVIGSGPFVFAGWEPGRSATAKRNPDYFRQGRPFLDQVTWLRVADQATLLSAFRTQNLDVLVVGFTKTDADNLKRERPELVTSQRRGTTRFEVSLKGDRPPFNDIRVRQAVFKAIDRQELIDTILDGVAHLEPGLSLGSPAMALPEDEIKRLYAYDPEGARQLLRQAGVTSLDVDFQVANFLSGLVVQVGELVEAQLRRVGLNFNIRVVDGAVYTGPIRVQGQYIAALGLQGGGGVTSGELLLRHHSKGSQFSHGIADPELDRMIDQQSTMVKDPAGRARLIQEIQRKFIGLYGYNMLFAQDSIYVSWPYVKDWNINGVSNTQADFIHTWHDK
jgi:peptide/nickel transport system substrate-binding protein